VVAGEPVDACGSGSLFGRRDGSGRRIDGLHGGERQRKGCVVGPCNVIPSIEEEEGGVACCGQHPVGSRGAGSGRRKKKKKEGRRERRKEKERKRRKRENEEKKLRKKEKVKKKKEKRKK
jgi:hypothetical protein